MVCLAQFRHAPVVTNQEGSAGTAIVGILLALVRHVALLDTLVVVREDGRNVQTIRTRHAVVALVARDGLQIIDILCNLHQEQVFLFRQRLQRRIGTDVFLQVLHIAHSAQYAEHVVRCSGKSESPACHALLRLSCLHLCYDRIGHVGESAAQEGFHDDGRNAALLQFAIEIHGIRVQLVDFVGIVPVQIVQHEIPMILAFVVPFQGQVEHLDIAMIGETEVADASFLLLFYQPVEDSVVNISAVEILHAVVTRTDGV